MTPLVTVLMPVYNGEKYLKEAIDSILNQTFKDFEFLIINDGSTDNSVEIIKSYKDKRIRLVSNKKNIGLIGTLNKGMKLARGKYVARMDQDDISICSRLELQVKYLKKNNNCVLVGTNAEQITLLGEYIKFQYMPNQDKLIRHLMLVENCFFHGSVCFSKNIALKVGGYDKKAVAVEDYSLWIKLLKMGSVVNLNKVLYRYRVNPQGISIKSRKTQLKNFKIFSDKYWNEFDFKINSMQNYNNRINLYENTQFAKRYLERGKYVLSLKHLLSAFVTNILNPAPYFYLLMWIIPMRVFCVIEEFLLYNLFIKKNSQ